MSPAEAQSVLNRMCERWPNWFVTKAVTDGSGEDPSVLVQDWLEFLEELGGHDHVELAIKAVQRSTNYNPTMDRVAEARSKILRRQRVEVEHPEPIAPKVWVQCVATTAQGHDTGAPNLYGQFKGLWYGEETDEDKQVQHAEQFRQRCEQLHGGQWNVRRQPDGVITEREMFLSYLKMQESAGLSQRRGPRRSAQKRRGPQQIGGFVADLVAEPEPAPAVPTDNEIPF